jgi:UDP-N-acetylglucosamine 2-epimerase (non-hydrolysing)
VSIAIILGTRPEIIKMSPVIRECEQMNLDYFILHTGQHYSYEMDRVFFEQTGKIISGIEKVLIKERPDAVLVQGDTNTVLAGALPASKLHIRVGHVEAGPHSYDRRMPEEINRVLADHCSDYLFAPTKGARNIRLGEGIPEYMIYVTGNTIVDAISQNLKLAQQKTSVQEEFDIERGQYFFATVHRQENVDNPKLMNT